MSQLLFIINFNFNFSSQYVLLGLTLCNTSNIVYYTAILCHKHVVLVLVRLIAIRNFNWSAALLETGYDDNDNNVKQSENKDISFDDKNLQIHTVYHINDKRNIFGSVHRLSTAWPEVRIKSAGMKPSLNSPFLPSSLSLPLFTVPPLFQGSPP